MLFVKNSDAIQNRVMANNRRNLSPEEVEACKNLKSLWELKKQELRLTQESAAHELGYKTQGAVSQYLNGRVPLNLSAILGFAKLLGVSPLQISEKLVPREFISSGTADINIDVITDPTMSEGRALGTNIDGDKIREIKTLYQSLPIRSVPVISKKNIIERINTAELNNENHKAWCPTKSVSAKAFALSAQELPTPNDRFGFHPSSFIIIDPDYELETGKLVLVLDDNNNLSIKRYEAIGKLNYLGSFNENYQPILLDETFQLIGRVAGSYQEF